MGAPRLHVVDDETTSTAPDHGEASEDFKNLQDAADQGTRLDELVQLRGILARALDSADTSPRDLAALSRRYVDVSKEIEALQKAQAEQESDDDDGGDYGEEDQEAV